VRCSSLRLVRKRTTMHSIVLSKSFGALLWKYEYLCRVHKHCSPQDWKHKQVKGSTCEVGGGVATRKWLGFPALLLTHSPTPLRPLCTVALLPSLSTSVSSLSPTIVLHRYVRLFLSPTFLDKELMLHYYVDIMFRWTMHPALE
jgi:hypothetical protein